MTQAAAKPFDFDEFGAKPAAPAAVYTAADIEEARTEAHEAAVSALVAEQARAQSDLLEKISAQLTAARSEFDNALAERRVALTETAREIVTTFCAGIAADQQIEIALNLLDNYLSASPDQTPVALVLPAETTDASIAALKGAIESRHISEFAVVATSAAIAAGDCRIEWRGGSMRREMTAINEEIKNIFASMDSDEAVTGSQKARKP